MGNILAKWMKEFFNHKFLKMITKINYKDGYLHCSVSDNISEWADLYESAHQCWFDLSQTVEDYCKICANYDDEETEVVMNHYEITIHNWNGEWLG